MVYAFALYRLEVGKVNAWEVLLYIWVIVSGGGWWFVGESMERSLPGEVWLELEPKACCSILVLPFDGRMLLWQFGHDPSTNPS